MLSRLSDNVAVISSIVSNRIIPDILFLAASAGMYEIVFGDPKLHSVVSYCSD